MTKKKYSTNNATTKLKVLYQNLSGTWYAFATVGESVFFGKVPLQVSSANLSPVEKEIVKQFPKGKKNASKSAA